MSKTRSKAELRKLGEIYILKNTINGKTYVGQAICLSNKGFIHGRFGRWKTHLREAKQATEGCWALNNSINKHGSENFTVRLLKTCLREDMNRWEQHYIKKYDSMYPNGYNIRSGGSNGKHCDASREKMRQKKLGKNNHNYGKPRTEEARKNISEAKKGEKHHFYGKHLTYEHKLNLSKSHKTSDLPMYMVHLDARPKQYQAEGYAIINHPSGIKKYFTSKKLSMQEKYDLAFSLLNDLNQQLQG